MASLNEHEGPAVATDLPEPSSASSWSSTPRLPAGPAALGMPGLGAGVPLTPEAVLALQRTSGNALVTRFLARAALQRASKVSQAADLLTKGASDAATGGLVEAEIKRRFPRKLVKLRLPDASFAPYRTEGSPRQIPSDLIGGKGIGVGVPDLATRVGPVMLVGEVKPANWLQVVAGEAQLTNYIAKGNSPDNAALRAEYGVVEFAPMLPSIWVPPSFIKIGPRRFRVWWALPGVLVYKELKKGSDNKKKNPKKKPDSKKQPDAKKKPGAPKVKGQNIGLGLSIASTVAGSANAGVGVAIQSQNISVGTVSAGVVYNSQGAAIASANVGASSGSSTASALSASAGKSSDSQSAGVVGASAGTTKRSTSAGAVTASHGSAEGALSAGAVVAGSGATKDTAQAAALERGSADAGSKPTGAADGGTGEHGTTGDAKRLADIIAGLGLPPGTPAAKIDALLTDAARLEQLVKAATPAQKTLLRMLAATTPGGVYPIPDVAWAEMMLTATSGMSEADLERLGKLEWRAEQTTAKELQDAIRLALAQPAGQAQTPVAVRALAPADVYAALQGASWKAVAPNSVQLDRGRTPALLIGRSPAGTRWGAVVTLKPGKAGETVAEASAVVVLDAAPQNDALSSGTIGSRLIFIGGARPGEDVDDGSLLTGLLVP